VTAGRFEIRSRVPFELNGEAAWEPRRRGPDDIQQQIDIAIRTKFTSRRGAKQIPGSRPHAWQQSQSSSPAPAGSASTPFLNHNAEFAID
jgi:hypothetical protein